ncbi:MAG: hypothetical protein J7L88_04835, partial [Thermoplasmata archaeon]|nr:hypothetical protein [Thermoplasmata archaeon]
SFERTLQGISKLRKGERIYLERIELKGRRVRFTDKEPLIFVDPVDPTRNVASSLSVENFKYIKRAARAYLRMPTPSFFFPVRVSNVRVGKECARRKLENIMEMGGGVLLIEMPLPPVQPDIYVSQARRFLSKSKAAFTREGFRVKNANFYLYSPSDARPFPPPNIKNYILSPAEHLLFLYTFASYKLGERRLHLGPPLKQKRRCEDFKRKWSTKEEALSRVFVYKGRLAVFVKRRVRYPHQMVPDLLRMLPSHLQEVSSRRVLISNGKKIDLDEFWEALFLHLTTRELWELKEDLSCNNGSP